MRKNNYHPYIDEYMDDIRSGKIPASKEIKLAMDYIEEKINDPDVFIDGEKINKATELINKYFGFKLLNWELFVLALIHCYYQSRDAVVFNEFLILMGRGNGKNGFISPLVWYLTTHYHGVNGYNVDIVANNEDQAKTSFEDIYEMLESTWVKSKKFFYKSKQIIKNLITGSYIKYNTSNSRTKDGKRSACLVFDELHEYENYDTINVFSRSFGKRKHSRIFKISTNGYVRGGVLDEELDIAKRVLSGEIKNLSLCPLIYKIDDKEEAKNPDMWVKANPSLPYFPELKIEMDNDFIKMEYQPHIYRDFMTKRMNCPTEDMFTPAVPWAKILATNKPIPCNELKGMSCIGAIDYAQIRDFVSVGLLFKYNGMRYWIEHTFVCHLALKMENRKIKFPVIDMADKGLITIVNDNFVKPEYISQWFIDKAKEYHIMDIVADDYRVSVLQAEFEKRGLPLHVCRSGPITHSKLAPMIEVMFADEKVAFGDNPTMRWYINNTKQELDPKGNTTYLKIEPKTRKTDGFFAFIHALTKDGELKEYSGTFRKFEVRTY